MGGPSPSVLIDRYIASLKDWRGDALATIRRLFHEADADVVEEWKWMGTPTWSHDGVLAVAMPMKDKVKVTFSRGAHLPDPHRVFNNGLGGKEWRALDIFEGDVIDPEAVKDLIRAAVGINRSEAAGRASSGHRPASPRPARPKSSSRKPR